MKPGGFKLWVTTGMNVYTGPCQVVARGALLKRLMREERGGGSKRALAFLPSRRVGTFHHVYFAESKTN